LPNKNTTITRTKNINVQSKSNMSADDKNELVCAAMRFCGVDDEYNRNVFTKLIASIPTDMAWSRFYDFAAKAEEQHIGNRAAYFTMSLKNLLKEIGDNKYFSDYNQVAFDPKIDYENDIRLSANIVHFGILKYLYEIACEYKGYEKYLALVTGVETLIYGRPVSVKTRDVNGGDLLAASHRRVMKRIYKIFEPFANQYRPNMSGIDEYNRMTNLYRCLLPNLS